MAEKPFDAKFIAEVERLIVRSVINHADKIAITAHNRLTVRTPVDTGQARRGWNFTLNQPDYDIPERPKYTTKAVGPKPKRKKGVKNEPRKRVYSGQKLRAKPSVPDKWAKSIGDKYHLTNSVPHILWLNLLGNSQQAPKDFIEIEIREAVKDVERGED